MPTIAYSTSTETPASRNRVAIARVAAAGRITAERKAAEKRAAVVVAEATRWRKDLDKAAAALGAVSATIKVCHPEGHKFRDSGTVEFIHNTAEFYDSRGVHDIEISYLDADGEFIDENPAAA